MITPDQAYDPSNGKGKLQETICNPGDVVMQRGALHAYVHQFVFDIIGLRCHDRWENRSSEWVRFLSVIIGAEATTVEVEGKNGAKISLPDCFDV